MRKQDGEVIIDGDDILSVSIRIVSDVLEQNGIGPDQNFFDLGGDSLLAVRALALVREELGPKLALSDFLELPTPRGLAALVIERLADDEFDASESEFEDGVV